MAPVVGTLYGEMGKPAMRRLLTALLLLLAMATARAADPAAGDSSPGFAPGSEPEAEVLAAAVRVRGFTCDEPRPPVRDEAASRADRPGWIVACEQGRFLVIYEGDTGPRVTPLD